MAVYSQVSGCYVAWIVGGFFGDGGVGEWRDEIFAEAGNVYGNFNARRQAAYSASKDFCVLLQSREMRKAARCAESQDDGYVWGVGSNAISLS